MERKVFFAAAASAAALAAGCAKGRADELELVETSSQFDYAGFAKRVGRPAGVRQVWDGDGYHPQILGGIKNAYNGYQFGFGIAPPAIAMALCLHAMATTFAYNDAMWAKYRFGESFSLREPSGAPVAGNVFFHARSQANAMADPNDPHGSYQDATIEALQRRGLMVFACNNAMADHAKALVGAGLAPAGTEEAVRRELAANLMPGVSSVPSGVATIGLLQSRFRYAYATILG